MLGMAVAFICPRRSTRLQISKSRRPNLSCSLEEQLITGLTRGNPGVALSHPLKSAEEDIQWTLSCLAEKTSKTVGLLEREVGGMVIQLLLS